MLRENNNNKYDHDVIIIGGGPAGASTALYAVRGGLNVAVVHNNNSALLKAEIIQNYYGTGEVSGKALYEKGIEQIRALGTTIIEDQVVFVSADGNGFEIQTANGKYSSRALVIATGAVRRVPDIAGIKEYEGKGVSYCAVCDAFFYRKKRVAVLGAGEFAVHELQTLKAVADKAFLLTNGEKPSVDMDAELVITQKLVEITGDDRVKEAVFEDGSTLAIDGLFIALGTLGGGALAASLGIMTDKTTSTVKTDEYGRTNIPFLYAAGDCTRGIKQVCKAATDGMTVGTSLVRDLKGNN